MTIDHQFSESIPVAYQEYMVPMIFAPYAVDLATRVSAHSPAEILETAAGTGVVTKELVSRLSPNAHLTVTDLNQPMLDLAQKMIRDSRLSWQACDALSLPFENEKFDAVLCQFGAMFFPDHIRAYQEANRVLASKGRFYLNVWDQISENEFAFEVENFLQKYFPNNPPKFMSRTPHGYYDVAKIRRELEMAGFYEIQIETVSFRSRAPSSQFAAVAYCQGTPLRLEIESRAPGALQEVTRKVADNLAERFGTGAIEGKIQALVISARKQGKKQEMIKMDSNLTPT